MVPSADLHADGDPQGDQRLEPSRAFDPADVDGPRPTEVFQDPGDRLLRRGVVPADRHFWDAPDELWIDHLRVRDGIEGLHDPRAREGSLHALPEGVRQAHKGDEVFAAQRVRHVDQDLSLEVRGTCASKDVTDLTAKSHEAEELA